VWRSAGSVDGSTTAGAMTHFPAMGDAHAAPCEHDAIGDGEDAGGQGEEDEKQLERRHEEWVLHHSDNPSDMTSSLPASCSQAIGAGSRRPLSGSVDLVAWTHGSRKMKSP
jgi:hypothetical protein